MSGYKQTVIDDDVATFITFDGDVVDGVNGTIIASPLQIFDEIGNQNPAILHVESEYPPHGYRAGLPSLVKLEQTNQAGVSFGYYGIQSSQYTKAYLEIPHSFTYAFPNYGSFTVEFMMKKSNENAFISASQASITRPIISKNNVISITYNRPWGLGGTFDFWFPSGNTCPLAENIFLDKIRHLAVVWKIDQTQQNVYQSTEMIVVDGKIYYEHHQIYNGTFPNTNQNYPWLIAGTLGSGAPAYNDRNTSGLYLDQIAIYDISLTIDKIANHYKKIYSYDDMIVNDSPEDYFPLNEINNAGDWRVFNSMSGYHGSYFGSLITIDREAPAEGLMLQGNATAPKFSSNAMLYFMKLDYYSRPYPWFTINSNYAIEFWFKSTDTKICTLFSLQDNKPPFNGIEITLNERENLQRNGGLQVYESGTLLNSLDRDLNNNQPYYFNDGFWHHIVYQRIGTTLELWIDSRLHSTQTNISASSVDICSAMYCMGNQPRNRTVHGQMSKIARYSFGLQPQQIKNRFSYAKIYRIKGIVTLQGVPTRATIRVLDNMTGKLLGEVASDINTGEYLFDLPNNNKIDLMVFDRLNPSVRYRAYGAIVPSGNADYPVTI